MSSSMRVLWLLLGAVLGPLARAVPSDRPYHLQVNYQRSPALGVGRLLRFSWAVPAPALPAQSPHRQGSYRIVITALDGAAGSPFLRGFTENRPDFSPRFEIRVYWIVAAHTGTARDRTGMLLVG